MSKRAAPIKKSEFSLDQHASAPLYKQLYERVRAQILAGQMESGARLPSTRTLAGQLGISRNTTALAYELLQLEGYIESRVGDGTRVARLQPEQLLLVSRNVEVKAKDTPEASARHPRPAAQAQHSTDARQHSDRARLIETIYPGDIYTSQYQGGTGTNIFPTGQPDVSHFPYDTWARLVARHARQSLQGVSLYQNAQGYFPLREAIAAHIGISRGVHCSPEQIIMTAGSQGALDLVARVLLNPGDPAWIEDPGYFGARGSLLAAGARLMPVPVDREGIDVEAGRRLSRDARREVKLAVVTPSHQFPTGVTMSLNRRLALLEWAREAQAWIVEDDYDSEYRYSGRPLEALQGLDSSRGAPRVIYIGTFSKVLFPSLRLGYMVAPPELLDSFVAARRFIDVHPPMLEQLALADFITGGHFGRHLRKMRLLYLERRDALVDALTRELGDMLEVAVPEAGLHLAAWLRSAGSDAASAISAPSAAQLARRAAAQGLHVLSISQFSPRPLQRDALILGFANASPEELRAGTKKLALALRA